MLTQAPTLETSRLRLRPLTLADYDALVTCWASPDTVRYIGSGQPQDSEMSWGRLLRYIGHWQLLGYGYWAVCEKESGLLIGTMGIQNQKRNLTPVLEYPEAGWTLSPTATGQGFATEALTAILAWADSTFAEPLCCIIDDDNLPSIRLAERMGFQFQHYVEYHNKMVRMLVRPLAS